MTDKSNKQESPKTNKSYETSVSELEGILAQLESNDLPLEDAIKQFESGVALIKHCQGILDTTEQKIQFLTEGGAPEKGASSMPKPQKSPEGESIPF